jgi:hypothetical protein
VVVVKMKTKVSVEEVKKLVNRIHEINKLDLSDIIWTENGVEIDVPLSRSLEFQFCGLSNVDFITTDCYKIGTE